MHGSIGGRWRNGTTLRGPLVPGWCAERRHHDGPIGTSTAAAIRKTSGLPHRTAAVGARWLTLGRPQVRQDGVILRFAGHWAAVVQGPGRIGLSALVSSAARQAAVGFLSPGRVEGPASTGAGG